MRNVSHFFGLVVALWGAVYAGEYHDFVFIICSYNNVQWYARSLDSVRLQKYPGEHWRILYFDDASTDGTGDAVRDYIAAHDLASRVQLVRNDTNRGAMANTWEGIQLAHDHEIIIILDGDDWLYDDTVLAYLNDLYQSPQVWMTYGGYEHWPSGHRGLDIDVPEHIVANNAYRRFGQMTCHLRSGYAWLHKKINKEDLMKDGEFVRMSADVAVMMPLLELSGGRFKHIDRLVYVYNFANPLSDHRKNMGLQEDLDRYIRHKTPYQPLELKP